MFIRLLNCSSHSHLAEFARLMTRSCLSVAFFITSEYTRFFLPEEALRIKSEKGVDLTVFGFENIDIILNLGQTKHLCKVGGSIFFRDMIVNLIYTRFIQPVTVISILK